MFRILFHEPSIPGNTGNAIRLAAATGAELHLVEPLGFTLDDARLRRAGLDYHDLAVVTVHADLDTALTSFGETRVLAFTTKAERRYTDVAYERSDVLMFGTEPTGLPDDVLADPRVDEHLRLPMLPGRRSMNLANCASIVVFEAWRQHDFLGA
jgi:tRNA (cytidine/uridine-2'-O-)-methyltransferase